MEGENERLKAKLRDVNPYKIQRKLKRKDDKIARITATMSHLKREGKSLRQKHVKNLTEKVRYYKDKCDLLMSQLLEAECEDCIDSELETSIEQLKKENMDLLEQNAEYIDTLNELQTRRVTLFKDGKYTDDLRICIMELLSYNVGILNVEPIIKSVLNLSRVKYDRLPKHTTINEILIESRSISHMQLAETLSQAQNTTLHSA